MPTLRIAVLISAIALTPLTLAAQHQHGGADKNEEAGASAASAAAAWASAKPPAACASDETAAAIALIAKESQALAQRLSANAPEAELTTAIRALHDRFETVEKRCGGHAGMTGMKHG